MLQISVSPVPVTDEDGGPCPQKIHPRLRVVKTKATNWAFRSQIQHLGWFDLHIKKKKKSLLIKC